MTGQFFSGNDSRRSIGQRWPLTGAHILVGGLHISSVVLHLMHRRLDGIADFWTAWTTQVSILIGTSLFCFVLAIVLSTLASRISLLGFQGILYSIGLYGEASFPLPLFAWGTAMIIEAHVLFPRTPGVIVSCFIALLSISLPRADSVWNVGVPDRQSVDLVAASLFYIVVIHLSALFHSYRYRERLANRKLVQLRESLIRLTSANVGFQDYAVTAEKRGIEDERHRITREIHDTLGYTLTSVIMMTKAAEGLIDTDSSTLRRLLQDARTHCQEAMVETRRTLHTLWDLKTPRTGFRKEVFKITRAFEYTSGIRVELDFRNLPDIRSSELEGVLTTTVKEGLTNAFRHGRASLVTVLFWYDPGEVSILIQDNGVGSTKVEEDIGIRGMRERFEQLGGRVEVGPNPGGGFQVRGWLPATSTGTETT